MDCSHTYFFLSLLLLFSILCINHTAMCDDEEETLLRGINIYRANLNLPALTENDKAECLAEEIADQFKNQPCTNTTCANTVPGTEPQFSDYPNLLAKCKLNVTAIRDGAILPAYVPNLVQDIVLTSYTHTQYSDLTKLSSRYQPDNIFNLMQSCKERSLAKHVVDYPKNTTNN